MLNSKHGLRSALFLGAATFAALTLATAASAQNVETVTVTGTLIQGNTNLVSPVTVIDTAALDKSGISSIQSALQQTLANNGPAVTNNWTANGNFAQGASGISLRGLSTNSTLVLFDGMRAAYYPLADDGIRNFVDLNTVSDDIVENIQVLKDGASASYGADAIAGVVNIITKKEFQGLSGRAEGGIADRGDAASWKFSLTAGVGDLAKDHVNAYISASYYHSDLLYAKSRPYPFNTYDWTNVCYTQPAFGTACGSNSVVNGINKDGTFGGVSTGANFLVRPYNYNATTGQITTAVAGSRYQNLDGCADGKLVSLTVAQQGATAPSQVCQYDNQNLHGVIEPMLSRFGLTGHTAFVLPSGIEGTLEANFMQDTVAYPGAAAVMYGNAPAGIYYPRYSTSTNYTGATPPAAGSHILYLPNWICPERVNCDTAADRKLNPNNPFASATNPIAARLIGRNQYEHTFSETRDRTYRVAGEVSGSLFDDWKWNVGFTASHIDLKRTTKGYTYIQHLLDVIADGTYNFVDPTKNSQAVLDYVHPQNDTPASSDLAQAQFSVTAPLYKLPGGDLTLVVGSTIFYEAVDAPSANSDANGPTQRYFTENAFGTKGSRDVYAGFFELKIPVIEEFVVDVSGRYDSYSSGQSNFSPKIGFWSKPFESVTVKGTYSQGFRIPSFAEANALPTTGYVTNTASLFTDAFLANYGCTKATFSTACPVYIKNGSYGLTTIASPNLKPENSRSWVADVTYQPFDELTLETTYYNIKKTGAIANLNCSAAITGYYANPNHPNTPAGCAIQVDSVDPNFPAGPARLLYVNAPLVNANAVRTAGWDFSVTYDSDLDGAEKFLNVQDVLGAVHMTSSAQATFIQNLDTKFADGTIERYDGTLGNNNLTAGTGTPKWRGLWQTTFSTDRVDFTSTLNWSAGYNVSAMDQGNAYRECGVMQSNGTLGTGLNDGSVPCRIADYFTWDVNAQYKLNDNIKIYGTVLNVLDAMPPVDTIATYAITGYNVVTTGDGILGRYLKIGIKLDY